MSLNTKYVVGPDLQMYFVDKDTGAPLAGGIITFYEDDARTILKPIYQLNGTYPYGPNSFTQLNNPITLTSVGTFADNNGNDIIPYFYPYDANGDLELYYITVYSSGLVLQFTREAWPPNAFIENDIINNANEMVNYVPNPQFLLHNTTPLTAIVGLDTVNYIAPGGWTFEKPTSSTSTDTISFPRITNSSSNSNVTADPRYLFQLNVVEPVPPSADARKDLVLEFPDVNKFNGDPANPNSEYTLSFQGGAVGTSITNVQIFVKKYFGTSGSATQVNLVTAITLNSIVTNVLSNVYTVPITFGNNAGFNVDPTTDNDYVEILIRFPNISATYQLSDFILTPGFVTITDFPQTTNAEMIENSTVGWLPTPNPDGSSLYLPLVLTQQGATYDDSGIGEIFAAVRPLSATNNELACDGSSYTTTAYSPLGVPYARLQKKLFNATYAMPIFGTGAAFVNAYINSGSLAHLLLYTNSPGSQTNSADGTPMTNFTITTPLAGTAGIGFTANSNSIGLVTAYGNFTTSTNNGAGANAHTTGMSVVSLNNPTVGSIFYAFTVLSLSAAALANGAGAGKYFTFSNSNTDFYVWFFSGAETDPTPGGTGIKITMDTGMLAYDIGIAIANAINSTQSTQIVIGAASTIAAGSNFLFNANATTYTVWYQKAGLPATTPIGLANPIKVVIGSADAANTVTTATQLAINSMFFAVPNLQGIFLRGTDLGGVWDIDYTNRWGAIGLSAGGGIGTFEFNQILNHNHSTPANTPAGATNSDVSYGSGGGTTGVNTSSTGGSETRPVNMSVNYFIKY